MAITFSPLLLKTAETGKILPLDTYVPDTYLVPIQSAGNSLLSSLLVLSLASGASVTVNYFQTTSANEQEERTIMVGHQPITAASVSADQILITRIHNKVYAEIIVTGGPCRLGVFGTVVSSFATDTEAALKRDGQPSNLLTDRGSPVVIRDTTTGLWELWEGEGGIPAVRLIGDVQVNLAAVDTPTIVNASLPDTLTEVVVPIPLGARRYVIKTRSGAPMRVAFEANGTTTTFITTGMHQAESLDAAAILTVYARTERSSGDVLELLSWS